MDDFEKLIQDNTTYELCALYCDYNEWLASPTTGPRDNTVRAKYEAKMEAIVRVLARRAPEEQPAAESDLERVKRVQDLIGEGHGAYQNLPAHLREEISEYDDELHICLGLWIEDHENATKEA